MTLDPATASGIHRLTLTQDTMYYYGATVIIHWTSKETEKVILHEIGAGGILIERAPARLGENSRIEFWPHVSYQHLDMVRYR